MLCPPPWSRLSLVSQLVSGLGCCVPLPSLGLLLSPILSPNLSPILAGMLSQLVLDLGWDAVSASLVSSCFGLRSCLLGCRALVSGLASNFPEDPILKKFNPCIEKKTSSILLKIVWLRGLKFNTMINPDIGLILIWY